MWWCAGHIKGPAAVRLSLKANFATSGPGDVRAGILVAGRPLIGVGGAVYSIETADPGFGDFVDKALTWNGGHTDIVVPSGVLLVCTPTLPRFTLDLNNIYLCVPLCGAGVENVSVQVAMRAAKLFSLELVCAQ